uniref:Uncharacterized protein n=1 Tax=Rhipicephalus appendiculatus TaxID=34631 RepID=A0A131YE85_RHIAP
MDLLQNNNCCCRRICTGTYVGKYIALELTIKPNIVDVKVPRRFSLRVRAFYACPDKDATEQQNFAFLFLFFRLWRARWELC